MKQILLFLIPVCCLFAACIEELPIEVLDRSQLLVVEGVIHDQEGPYTVALTWSSQLDSASFLAVTGAEVRVESSSGEVYLLPEGTPGHYDTPFPDFQGEVGKSYRLKLSLASGQQYESDWVKMKKSPPIDSIYYQLETIAAADSLITGMQVYLNTGDPENETFFYRWQWEETWRYAVPFPARLRYLGNNLTTPFEPKEICWTHTFSDQISVASSIQNTQDLILGHPLLFVDVSDHRLQDRYSLLVRQYALDEKQFLFWNSLSESIESGGSLFDRQPQSIVGNVRNLNDPEEPVLGYFAASGISEKRIYINRSEVRTRVDNAYRMDCISNMDTIRISDSSEIVLFDLLIGGSVFYDFQLSLDDTLGYLLGSKVCTDCTARGGTTEKPPFWTD